MILKSPILIILCSFNGFEETLTLALISIRFVTRSLITNLYRIHTINLTNTTQEIGTIYKTNIKLQSRKNAILAYGSVGPGVDLNDGYQDDIFNFVLGISSDGYLQYSITECSSKYRYRKISILEFLNTIS